MLPNDFCLSLPLCRSSEVTEVQNICVDDTVLVRQCRSGDSAAMERLIIKYQNRIYNVILKICQNPDDAAELTQDTFVKIIEKLDSFQARSGFYTWAFRIAVNLTLNHCKRALKLTVSSLDANQPNAGDADVLLKDILADKNSPDPAVVAQMGELCELVQKALMKLDDHHRAVIVLRDIEGMDYAQIAEVLNTQLGTVKSRLSRARSSLRDIMEALVE